jgi:hypothetical protein
MNYSYKFDPKEVAVKTADAYSADRYNSWTACALLLARRGFNRWEAEAILRSKIMRWVDGQRLKAGKVTSGDLADYLDQYKVVPHCAEVNELVMGTFSGDYLDLGCPDLHLELNDKGVPCHRGTMPGNPGAGSVLVELGTSACCDPTTEQYWSM